MHLTAVRNLLRLAQLVEQWTGNPEVGDSSPRPTNIRNVCGFCSDILC